MTLLSAVSPALPEGSHLLEIVDNFLKLDCYNESQNTCSGTCQSEQNNNNKNTLFLSPDVLVLWDDKR